MWGFQPLLKSCSLNLLCGINTTSKAARKLSTLTSIPLLFYLELPSTSKSLTTLSVMFSLSEQVKPI